MCCSVGNIQKRVSSSVAQAAPWYRQAGHHVASQLHTSLQFPGDHTATRKSCLHLPPFSPLFPEVTSDVFCVLRGAPTEALPCFTRGCVWWWGVFFRLCPCSCMAASLLQEVWSGCWDVPLCSCRNGPLFLFFIIFYLLTVSSSFKVGARWV